ncbi:MAG: hypothetical protein Q9225_007340, partial [Loekoesia sp. 1 TL-2023]
THPGESEGVGEELSEGMGEDRVRGAEEADEEGAEGEEDDEGEGHEDAVGFDGAGEGRGGFFCFAGTAGVVCIFFAEGEGG